MARFAMNSIVLKLNRIAGQGKFEAREYRVKSVLNWRNKAKSTIRHLLKGEQIPTLEEAEQIELAYVKHCAEKVEQNHAENARLFDEMRSAISAMQARDPEFYAPFIEALSSELLARGRLAGSTRGED
jgi:hypothetical protein